MNTFSLLLMQNFNSFGGMHFTFLTVLVPFLCIFQAGTLVQNSLFALLENGFLKTIPKGNGCLFGKGQPFSKCIEIYCATLAPSTALHCTLMRFSDLKETSTDITADFIFEKFR